MESIQIARRVIATEISSLQALNKGLDQTFDLILREIINCQGKIIIIGMGKSGHIGKKIAATFSSLGSCSIFVHPGEAMHGDLGMIQAKDIVIAISHSGESREICMILPNIRMLGAKLIGLTSNAHSMLARNCQIVQIFPPLPEACSLGLAPTTSTTTVLVYGDALAVAASELKGFCERDFGVFHPGGSLGKKITTQSTDIMQHIRHKDAVFLDSTLMEAVLAFIRLGTDLISVIDESGKLVGVLTNGTAQREILKEANLHSQTIRPFVNCHPIYVDSDTMAVDALQIMIENSIQSLPVVKEERVVGILSKEAILNAGIYI